jgi:hypothetical protein
MIPYSIYKLFHLFGILMAFVALAGTAAHAAAGGERTRNPLRRSLSILHGVGWVLIALGGFGMLARIGVDHGARFPGWVWGKLAIWLITGGLIALPYRRPALAGPALLALPALGALAASLALFKP